MDSIYFSFDGEKSSDLDIYLVKLQSGFIRAPFLGDREIVSESIPGNDVPYVYDIKTSPLRITLTLSCLEGFWTFEKRREIARWLNKKYFAEFYSADNVSKLYYLMYQGGIDLQTNGIQQGYIEVEFVNISPYTYSPVYRKVYDLSTITTQTNIEFVNNGDNYLKPQLKIYKIGNGDLSIKNLSDGGKEFKFTNIYNFETIIIDNINRIIETDIPGVYRHDNFNGNYLSLSYGKNILQITGKCELEFIYQFEFMG